ncbi:hypothetical protein HPE56_10675 [Maribacter sp. ANRC-HE7]|uniref:Uncharacterized protein n=1 Tax=Maribacter aquimaris TaxID=2737171 RepID=A0ABR7V0E9_9FLAO|nr:hypothetical protein [Maribacter aquimaris]MBD0778258.1 hypothetical protein [Maribacter aquimaris]
MKYITFYSFYSNSKKAIDFSQTIGNGTISIKTLLYLPLLPETKIQYGHSTQFYSIYHLKA